MGFCRVAGYSSKYWTIHNTIVTWLLLFSIVLPLWGIWRSRPIIYIVGEKIKMHLIYMIRKKAVVTQLKSTQQSDEPSTQKKLAIYTAICVHLCTLSQYLHVYEIQVRAEFRVEAGLEQIPAAWSKLPCCAGIL
jgi:hypothetical protein